MLLSCYLSVACARSHTHRNSLCSLLLILIYFQDARPAPPACVRGFFRANLLILTFLLLLILILNVNRILSIYIENLVYSRTPKKTGEKNRYRPFVVLPVAVSVSKKV